MGAFKKVLVIEDDSSVRLAVCHYLRSMGWTVEEVDSGEAALRAVCNTSDPIDLVLTDCRLRDIDGRDLATRVQFDCPFIFMTGSSVDAASLPGPVLRKPFDEDALREVVAGVVSRASCS